MPLKKKFIFILLVSLLLINKPIVVFAQDYGLDGTAKAAKLDKYKSVPTVAGNVIGTALSMIGVLFFILMIYGGFLWMTAKGDDTQSKKALDTITAATIGMIIVLASYAITNFVFKSVPTGGGGGGGADTSLPTGGNPPSPAVSRCQDGGADPSSCETQGYRPCSQFGSQFTCQATRGCCTWR